MSERIAVGDLVVVVRGLSCGCLNRVGEVFRVSEIRKSSPTGMCTSCNAIFDAQGITVACGHPEGTVNIKRLKRIPPLEELERETRKEEIEA